MEGTVQALGSILIIEDDKSIQQFLRTLLEDEGYEVRQASNGLEALDLLNVYSPNLILLDIAMPLLDGWGFLKGYQEQDRGPVPIIALSATANFRLPEKWVGFSGFLAKPFNISELLNCITQYLGTSVPCKTAHNR